MKKIFYILSILLLGIIAGCGKDEAKELSYDDFEHIHSEAEITTQSEKEYIVYYYGDYCNHCSEIKEDILAFANENTYNYKVYFLNSSDASIGGGTPSVFIVVDGKIVDDYSGDFNLPLLIYDINNGVYKLED